MKKSSWRKWLPAGQIIVGGLFAIAIALLPIAGLYKSDFAKLIHDPFARANLAAPVSWHWTECLFGGIYLLGIIACFVMMRRHFRKAITSLVVMQVCMIQITAIHFTPKIEAYSQRAAINFFTSLKGRDVYVMPLGYKSYAHLFYTAKLPSANPNYYGHDTAITKKGALLLTFRQNEEWLLQGVLDKPAYFICKITDEARYSQIPTIEKIGAANGFVFFKRK